MTGRPITGRMVLAIFVGAFGVIIAVNLVLAVSAVRTFPGLEVENSYVASQQFDALRSAQEALGWQSAVAWQDGRLRLMIDDRAGRRADVARLSVMVGRATSRGQDSVPALEPGPDGWSAPLALAPGKWEVRIDATAADGTPFRQRLDLVIADTAR